MSTIKHLKFIATYPKIGSDMYFTHWLLFFKPFRLWFQKRKVKKIGTNSEIRPYCVINGTGNVIIGNNVTIPEGTRLFADPTDPTAEIIIEDNVLLAPNVSIYCSTHSFNDITIPIQNQPFTNKTTTLREGCWIGINVVILPGVTIGKNSVVGANSLVNKDVPDYCVAVGSPAKIIRNLKENKTNH
jgi:acetyltransferase-like isoleucine patch superfamily enzyme